jgi:hypothetical protein
LEADRQLIAALRDDGFQGSDYDQFEYELAAYAFKILMAWMRNGKIFHKCRERGRPVPVEMIEKGDGGRWDAEDQIEIANLTIAYALRYFRDQVLVPGTWSAGKGATIKTYFIGMCLLQFGNQFRSVMRQQLAWDRRRSAETIEDAVGRLPVGALGGAGPEETVLRQELLISKLLAMPEQLRIAAVLILDGHSHAAAAAAIGISEAALSERFRRLRRRHNRTPEGGTS